MNGSPGNTPNVVHHYQAGKVYGPDTTPPMPANLSEVFLRERWAEPVEEKAVAAAPENKMLDGAEENKGDEGAAVADDDAGAPAASQDDDTDVADAGAADETNGIFTLA